MSGKFIKRAKVCNCCQLKGHLKYECAYNSVYQNGKSKEVLKACKKVQLDMDLLISKQQALQRGTW